MKVPGNALIVLLLLVMISCLFPSPAHAYLDPGTGSYVLQMLLAALVGALFAIRLFWGRIRAFFRRLFGRQSQPEETKQDEQE